MLAAGIVGFHSPLPWIALAVMATRNFAGDVRDAAKDSSENMKTLPVILGMKRNVKYVHLVATLLTTAIWWTYTSIPPVYLAIIFLAQISSYDLTPR